MAGTSYQASDGCDSQGSDLSFDLTGQVLTFGGTIMSMGECALGAPGPPAGTFAPPEYFNALKGAVHASLQGATLTLTSEATVMTFSRGSTTPTSSAPTVSLPDQLIGPKWALESITSGGQTWQAPADVGFSLNFSKAGYGGQDGCNYTGGAATYSAGSVRLLPGAETAMACSGVDAQRMQNAFAALLTAPVTATVADGTLMLSVADELVRLRPDPLWHQLGGVKWILQTWNRGTEGARLASGLRDGILFTPTSIDANDGCNDYIAPATYSTEFVDLGQVTPTQAACAANPVSDAFRSLFDTRFRVAINGTQLTLTGHGVKLVFNAGPKQSYPPPIGAEPANPSMTVPPPAAPSSP
jgi:heat shock protein HslJ